MALSFTKSELAGARSDCEHAIRYYGTIRVGDRLYHPLDEMHMNRRDAENARERAKVAGFNAIVRREAPWDPRYRVFVCRPMRRVR